MHRRLMAAIAGLACTAVHAVEVTMQNDSVTDFSSAVVVTGFIAGGGAGSWLTSPCAGDLRAVQVFWRSQGGTSGQAIHDSIRIYRSGTFPIPGALAETIGGPVLNDYVLNEWRFLDETQLVPLVVPVAQNESVVIALFFAVAPPAPFGPSVARDTDGIQPQRNTIYSNFGAGFEWRSAESLGVNGDWVIRAVIDCAVESSEADVAVGMSADPASYIAGAPLNYTIVVDNAGPAAANDTIIVDLFPAEYTGVTWTCSAMDGASCAPAGAGNIIQSVNLPSGGAVVFDVNGMVAAGTSDVLDNMVSATVAEGITDPFPDNNTVTLTLFDFIEEIFADGFEEL